MKSIKEAAEIYAADESTWPNNKLAFKYGARFERERILKLLREQPTMQNLRPSIWDEVTDWLEKRLGEIDSE